MNVRVDDPRNKFIFYLDRNLSKEDRDKLIRQLIKNYKKPDVNPQAFLTVDYINLIHEIGQ